MPIRLAVKPVKYVQIKFLKGSLGELFRNYDIGVKGKIFLMSSLGDEFKN